ncbi:MAG: hypothetical protein H6721_28905 [Sandaracinus sp.]|nr:hypothetical protein [Sandaracinus sp.]
MTTDAPRARAKSGAPVRQREGLGVVERDPAFAAADELDLDHRERSLRLPQRALDVGATFGIERAEATFEDRAQQLRRRAACRRRVRRPPRG